VAVHDLAESTVAYYIKLGSLVVAGVEARTLYTNVEEFDVEYRVGVAVVGVGRRVTGITVGGAL